jgi:hypothetical protein
MVIFSGAADLLAKESLKEMCHAEDRVMAMSGYSNNCAMAAATCTGNPPSDPGLASVHDGNSRCLPPKSLVRFLMAKYDVKTCDEFTTKSGLDANIETVRTKLATCADAFRADPENMGDCRDNGFNAAGTFIFIFIWAIRLTSCFVYSAQRGLRPAPERPAHRHLE